MLSLQVLAVALIAIAVILRRRFSKRQDAELPPGPRGLPFFGSLFSMPKEAHWLWWEKHHKKYGPVVCAKVPGWTMISIGDLAVAEKVFGKGGHNFADRPQIPLLQEYIAPGILTGMGEADEEWRMARRVWGERLNDVRRGHSESAQEVEACITARAIAQEPGLIKDHFSRHALSTLTSLIYAHRQTDSQCSTTKSMRAMINDTFDAITPGSQIVNVFPFLDRLPKCLAPWRKSGTELNTTMKDLSSMLCKSAMCKGEDSPNSWVKLLHDHPVKQKLPNGDVAIDSMMFVGMMAGAHTSVKGLNDFVRACTEFPEFLPPLRKAIDDVVGENRLPTFADRSNLLLVEATAREVQRWGCQAPPGIPHGARKDDVIEVNGKRYLIPKGAVIFPMLWVMTRDPVHFPDPNRFDPFRHFGPDGKLVPDRAAEIIFGQGDRRCPGRPLAERGLFINVALLVWTFDFVRTPGPNGQTQCKLVPRDKHRMEVLEKHWEESEKDLGVLLANNGN